MIPLVVFVAVWLVYLVLAAVKSRGSRVDSVVVIGAVVLSTLGFFVRGLIAGTSLDSMFYGSALLSALILVVTLGDPSLMFDIHLMKGKQFRRLPKAEQLKVKARDKRSAIAQLTFALIVVVAVSLYVGLDWTFLD
ncbi:hypothetical protein [Kribbella sp. NPDC051620]|uniref:hypothetical protein n=1 Tax=Kribbella sp. NPDC051620 TaxID=3364120 RepID=UPI0037B0B9CB